MPFVEYIAEEGPPSVPMGPGQPDLEALGVQLAPMFAVGLIGWHALRAYRVRAKALEKERERTA